MSHAIGIDDVLAARAIIADQVQRTPMLPSPRLSAATGADVFVKYENMQTTGSFKERGALVRLSRLGDDERRRGVVTMSAGNHAQAVAYHAARLGIDATIVMPETTPLVKVENTRGFGATVVLHGATLYESAEKAAELVAAEGRTLVHPYDDAHVMAGQGSVALEMLEETPDLDCLVIPIGGGGLFAGMAVAAKAVRPDIVLYGVEAALYPSFVNAIDGGDRPVGGPTLAEGIAVKTVGRLTLPIVRDLAQDILLVDETAIEDGVNAYATLARTMAEGAGAAGLAAMLAYPDRFAGRCAPSGVHHDPLAGAAGQDRPPADHDRRPPRAARRHRLAARKPRRQHPGSLARTAVPRRAGQGSIARRDGRDARRGPHGAGLRGAGGRRIRAAAHRPAQRDVARVCPALSPGLAPVRVVQSAPRGHLKAV
jgi:threonine dehydratase